VFSKEGTITAGNASGITDGAAFVHVSDRRLETSVMELIDFETVALDPRKMGLGPVAATQRLLKRHGLTVNDIEAFEMNEAFAAQVIACNRELKVPFEKINQHGGAIALGHPIGATGARILVTLSGVLKNKTGALGIATLCVSGGQGVSVLVKMI
jgi:acetyl-CoA acetyltransferase